MSTFVKVSPLTWNVQNCHVFNISDGEGVFTVANIYPHLNGALTGFKQKMLSGFCTGIVKWLAKHDRNRRWAVMQRCMILGYSAFPRKAKEFSEKFIPVLSDSWIPFSFLWGLYSIRTNLCLFANHFHYNLHCSTLALLAVAPFWNILKHIINRIINKTCFSLPLFEGKLINSALKYTRDNTKFEWLCN